MGVSFVKFKGDDRVVTIARNAEIPTAETGEAEVAEETEENAEQDDATQPDEGQDP
jgi:DNA gyrase subunit A